MTLDARPDLQLPSSHPLADRTAHRCSVCLGFFYPPGPPTACPYCNPEEDE